MRKRLPRLALRRGEGYALPTVIIFCLVLIIAGMAFFAMASYETRGALYRENSSEAFYLADGAIERARARFLADRPWFRGLPEPQMTGTLGRGTYELIARDTVYTGYDNVVKLISKGEVKNAKRRIEVLAEVPPTTEALTVLIMGEADIKGNLCVGGSIHLNPPNEIDDASHVTCDPKITTGFTIIPPPIFTDPAHFPDATYFYVKGSNTSPAQAKVFDRDGNDITAATGNLSDVLSYTGGAAKTFTYSFNATTADKYFNESTGKFKPAPGNTSVVVNFGEAPVVNPPGIQGVSALDFDASGGTTIRATVINTRYIGPLSPDSLRTVAANWQGAKVAVKQIAFEPRNGIAIIAYDMEKQGSSHVQLGTAAFPALVYITHDVVGINSNFGLVGSIICLGDFHSTGGPDITYNPGFIPSLPDYLHSSWPTGESGSLKILRWRELAAGS